MQEYQYGNIKRKAFENTITNMKVFMQAMCGAMNYKKKNTDRNRIRSAK